MKRLPILIAASLVLAVASPALAGTQPILETDPADDASWLEEWRNGKYATGNWFGLRDSLEDRGIIIEGKWRANFLVIIDGGLQQRGGFDEEINFDLGIDFAKLIRVGALEGLTFTGNARWRDGSGITQYAGTDSTFRPSSYSGGQDWRLRKFYLTYTMPQLFGIEDFAELSGGWQVPADLFLNQPESKLFVNHSIRTAKGINLNGISWGGSFSTWGGYLKLNPTDWLYAQSGLYLAYPFGTDENNHALSMAGYQIDPRLNGVYSINELGVTPKIGSAKLPGKYAVGLIYWGVQNTAFDGQAYQGRLQLYWQADQMLFREPSPEPEIVAVEPDGKSIADAKEVAPPVAGKPKLSKQGLYFFSTINYAPPENNVLPFYVLTGLVYKGLIPTRDEDQVGVAFAYGTFSQDEQDLDFSRGRDPRTYEGVIEFDYRIQINRFAYVQPTAQYIIRPGGRGVVENDTIIGLHFGVNF